MPGIALTYPFSAIVGQERAKAALQCALVDDDLSGVLILGPSGTAKSLLARSLRSVTQRKVVELPPGSDDDEIFGGIDIENALENGTAKLTGSVMSRADGNILYIDNVNLMDIRTLSSVMECVCRGKVRVEREGVSAEYPCRTTVVATMDPAEKALPDAVMDRFDLCAVVVPEESVAVRSDIVELELEYSADPAAFCERFRSSDNAIISNVGKAREAIHSVKVTRRDINDIARICAKIDVNGHRGDIACVRTARALAALKGNTYLTEAEFEEASVLCLVHRRGPPAERQADEEVREPEVDGNPEDEQCQGSEPGADETPEEPGETPQPAVDRPANADTGQEVTDTATELLDSVRADLAVLDQAEAVRLERITGRIPRTAFDTCRNGRTKGCRMPSGTISDPAFGATIKAAAPFQRARRPNGLSIVIEPSDIRENRRIRDRVCSFMFALDVSGSLSQNGRLDEAVQAVKAMLEETYARRDKVGLLTFGQFLVNLAVPFTRNVEAVFDSMGRTVTGGSTPLGQALLTLNTYLTNHLRKNPDEKCFVIMITDGEADTPVVHGNIPTVEMRHICETIHLPNTEWIIIDNGVRRSNVCYARKLADYLSGTYIRIDELLGTDR